jgi:hypothetical protein
VLRPIKLLLRLKIAIRQLYDTPLPQISSVALGNADRNHRLQILVAIRRQRCQSAVEEGKGPTAGGGANAGDATTHLRAADILR